MPWQECSVETERMAFVIAAQQQDVPIAALCRQFGISRKTGYKWLGRAAGGEGLVDRSRRPQTAPSQTPAVVEQRVVDLREQHPAWADASCTTGWWPRGWRVFLPPAPSPAFCVVMDT